jgi:hypothetical protein
MINVVFSSDKLSVRIGEAGRHVVATAHIQVKNINNLENLNSITFSEEHSLKGTFSLK